MMMMPSVETAAAAASEVDYDGQRSSTRSDQVSSRSTLLASRQVSVQPIVITSAASASLVVRSLSVSSSASTAGGDSPRLSPAISDYKNLLSATVTTTPRSSASSVDLMSLLAATNAASALTPAAPPPSITLTPAPSATAATAATTSAPQTNAQAATSNQTRREPVNRSESYPVTSLQPPLQLQRADSLSQPPMQPVKLTCGDLSVDSKKFIEVGKYILFDSNANNDTLSTAYNTENHNFYTWKKFTKQEYKKKLEPYFIMEGCSEHVYQISEIISDCSDQSAVYVMFDTYYGDLHTFMKEKKRLSEPEARHIFRQCVKAVQQCHENGIIVRDIKLKKFIFTNPERTKIALTNLEDCLVLDEDAPTDLIRSQQGCPAYVSPEVLNSQQAPYSGTLSDSWSLGIVLFTLLFGRYPFHHQVITSMFARIARAKFQIPPSSGLSADAKILLRSLIRLKPSERLRPFEILAHNWFKQVDDEFNFNLNHAQSSSSSTSAKQQNMSMEAANKFTAAATSLTIPSFMNAFSAHKPLGMSISAPNRLLTATDSRRNQVRKTTRPIEENDRDDDDDDECLVPVFEGATEASSN